MQSDNFALAAKAPSRRAAKTFLLAGIYLDSMMSFAYPRVGLSSALYHLAVFLTLRLGVSAPWRFRL